MTLNEFPLKPPVCEPHFGLPFRVARALFLLLPDSFRCHIYEAFLAECENPFRAVIRLPFGLALKMNELPGHTSEVAALRLLTTLQDINHPLLFDCVVSKTKARGYMVSTWVEGDTAAAVWDILRPHDLKHIGDDLRGQWEALRRQTECAAHPICSAAGGTIVDARVPWIAEERPRVFDDCRVFAEEVWLGLDHDIPYRNALRMDMEAVLNTVYPISFCHGDLLPKNLIFPGGLEKWREGRSRICLIDWEQSGWFPVYWDALKATWVEDDPESQYTKLMRPVFGGEEIQKAIDADWQWRSWSNIQIL